METTVLERLQTLEGKISELALSQRDVLTFQQACRYTDLSPSHLYKLTSQCRIPHSKPQGKRLYFDRKELDRWLLQNRVMTQDEIEEEATNLVTLKKRNVVR